MPIFQGLGRDKEKEEDRFFVFDSSSFKGFYGEKNLGREEEKPLVLQGFDTFFILFYVRAAKTNF